MPSLDQSVIRKAKLGLRAKSGTDLKTFIRDMREALTAIDERLSQVEAMVEDHETRITTLE